MTDHYLLMTATPHKGDPENFRLFLALLDRDVYGDVKSLEEAMRATRSAVLPAPRQGSPGHLPRSRDRRGQEALHQARRPDGRVRARRRGARLLRRAHPLRRRPVDQGRGRRLGPRPGPRLHDGDAPAPLRLQHLRRPPQPGADADKREKILDDPEGYRQEQIDKTLPDDFDDLPEEEQQEIIAELEDVVVVGRSGRAPRGDRRSSASSIDQARALEKREVESKLDEAHGRCSPSRASSATRR